MSTIKITGKVNSAICYAKVVEEEALDQIKRMCDSPMSEGSKIRIMPDVHSGKGCTIGTTMTITIHNYIDTKEMILRKGAIAAHEGEKVLIPINMRDGSILAVGKGNPEWNYSAPHGAGRIMSRRKAKKDLKLDDYIKAMEGIYTTSVNENTLDEAPMAYKGAEDIIEMIRESVDIIDILKPIYNFKSSE